jgi:NAD(P)-dependent dehydrogenase (short-subunit alcohol dehydrogenase family)
VKVALGEVHVAVITGAASGIGFALAKKAASEGMRVVLADVEYDALQRAADELSASGATVIAVRTDVSKAEDIEALAAKTLEAFGGVDLLFNNAGVGGGATTWETSLADWKWVLDVNLWGVIHGVHTFVPIMLKQDVPCHIVNTASIMGLISTPGFCNYRVSKFGVVALSETLYHELKEIGARVGVSVLCPGGVNTRILEAERNRPAGIGPRTERNEQHEMNAAAVVQAIHEGMSPERVAEITFQAIRDNRFYILTHPEYTPAVGLRAHDIVKGNNPTMPGG